MNSTISPGKNHQRLSKNRLQAKSLRMRNRARLHYLESQFHCLSSEARQLRVIAAYPEMFCGTYGAEVVRLFEKVEETVKRKDATEREIEEVLEECKEKVGVTGGVRREAVRETFRSTVDVVLPEILTACVRIGEYGDCPVETRSPTERQVYSSLLSHTHSIRPQILSLIHSIHTESALISRSADIISSFIEGLRPLLSSRQMALFALWIKKYYLGLSPELVLDFGRNTSEMLEQGDIRTFLNNLEAK